VNVAVKEMEHAEFVLRDEPMAKHTSWRVGGRADLFFKPTKAEDLQAFLASLPESTPLTWIGLGSNVLVRDGGIRGAVISTGKLSRELLKLDDNRVKASAGLPCASLARRCARWGLGPAAFFAGIPGSFGGAMAMNAGAYGGETWDALESVETIDRHGTLRSRQRSEYTIGYRSVSGVQGEWFLGGTLKLSPQADAEAAKIKSLLQKRSQSQPLGQRSAGSVFRNPQEHYAGELIEAAGLKGAQVGGAMVSDKHANFIINTGNASATEIEQLIDKIRAEVAAQFDVNLELEVRVLGERLRGDA